MSAAEKVGKKPPYKLLALDGGGIRGALSIEVLAAIEAQLRKHFAKPDLVLAECVQKT